MGANNKMLSAHPKCVFFWKFGYIHNLIKTYQSNDRFFSYTRIIVSVVTTINYQNNVTVLLTHNI